MKKIFLLLAAVLIGGWAVSAQGQSGTCGTTLEDQLLFEGRLLENIERATAGGVSERGAIQYVPVYFHLVGDASGNGKIKEARVLEQLCAMNTAFAPMDIRFYLRPHPTHGTLFNYGINNNNVYDNQTAWTTMNINRHPNAMNIFIVNQAGTSGNQSGLTLAYYSPQRDWIVSRKDQINGSAGNSTVPHEVGHFFSLQHTFLGWESQPFDQTFLTWPKAPATSPGGVATERVNGTNCTTAADKLCDTPPDYNFGFGASGCNYTGGAQDPNGDLAVPMANNMMGYFNFCSAYVFTQQQQNVVLADRASSSRNYLNNNFSPAATEINTPTDLLVSPAAGATVPYYDEVLFEWNAVPGATYYLLELDIVTSYSSPFSQSYLVNSTSKLVTGLTSNRSYFWRVRPINEYVTCATARQASFKTPLTSAVRTIEGLAGWQVTPNPVRSGASASVLVQAADGFEADIRVLDATGRQVYAQSGLHFSAGDSRVELPTGILDNNGLYVVLLQSGAGQEVRKIVVLR